MKYALKVLDEVSKGIDTGMDDTPQVSYDKESVDYVTQIRTWREDQDRLRKEQQLHDIVSRP